MRSRIIVHDLLLVALVGLAPAAVQAQGAADPTTEAKAQYELGTTAYGLGDYDRAIAAFTQANRLDPAPTLLFNIAQAYRKKGDRARAIDFYRRYLAAAPAAEDRERVQARIRELEGPGQPAGLAPGAIRPPTEGRLGSAAPVLEPAAQPGGGAAAAILPATREGMLLGAGDDRPIYRRPWFWSVVAAASLVTVAAIVFLRPEDRWTCESPECNLPTRTVF